jgi:hypothetical protein
MDAVILKRADHLQAGTVAHMREPRILVSAEVPLEDAPVGCSIEKRAPGFELADSVWRFPRVQLRHAPVVHILAAAHRIGEVDLPAVTIVDVGQRGCHAAFRHHRVRFAEERFAEQPDFDTSRRRLDRGAKPCSARANDEHIVLVSFEGQRILQSVSTPIEHSRM